MYHKTHGTTNQTVDHPTSLLVPWLMQCWCHFFFIPSSSNTGPTSYTWYTCDTASIDTRKWL